MSRATFAQRAETFGLDTDEPWALDALRLVFSTPRAYEPLVDAWDGRHPGTRRALDRLVDAGFVAYQPPVVLDLRTGEAVGRRSRKLPRYRTTAAGTRLAAAFREDPRAITDQFPRAQVNVADQVGRLLCAFDLDGSHAAYGLSAPHAIELAQMAERTGRWWVRKLLDGKYLRELDRALGDSREVVPGHWRITRVLCKQLAVVCEAFPAHAALARQLRLSRSRFLGDIDPARVGLSGATDYDHDIEAQRVLALALGSPTLAAGGVFSVEPRIVLPSLGGPRPWVFANDGGENVFYQPDAFITERERFADGRTERRRGVIEYERYQSRRDAWCHIERWCGWLHLLTLPMEAAVLRFVVDSEARLRGYVELIEAFADYALDHPERMPANPMTLAVSSTKRLAEADDPLAGRAWFRIAVTSGRPGEGAPVLHDPKQSPYNAYFARA